MVLAGMIRASETDLICDLAETYGVMDYKALPLNTLAALSAGLHEDSRIKMRITGRKISTNTILSAAVVDRLSLLVWMKTKDGANNRNRPESILAKLQEQSAEKDDIVSFRTPEEFEAAKARILERGG